MNFDIKYLLDICKIGNVTIYENLLLSHLCIKIVHYQVCIYFFCKMNKQIPSLLKWINTELSN